MTNPGEGEGSRRQEGKESEGREAGAQIKEMEKGKVESQKSILSTVQVKTF